MSQAHAFDVAVVGAGAAGAAAAYHLAARGRRVLLLDSEALPRSKPCGGGMAASWAINPDLPEGMVFENGSIIGVPLVNTTRTTYTVSALNSGGMTLAFLNITVLSRSPSSPSTQPSF